jgi:hypothetical protein
MAKEKKPEKIILKPDDPHSEDYAEKAKRVRERIERIKAERESRVKITELKHRLDNDYRLIKQLDGEYSFEQWKLIAEERRGWREELRKLL